jgi:hypothetical protein
MNLSWFGMLLSGLSLQTRDSRSRLDCPDEISARLSHTTLQILTRIRSYDKLDALWSRSHFTGGMSVLDYLYLQRDNRLQIKPSPRYEVKSTRTRPEYQHDKTLSSICMIVSFKFLAHDNMQRPPAQLNRMLQSR